MHSLSKLEEQLESIDHGKIASRKEAMKFVDAEKSVLDRLCIDSVEKKCCDEIINFWKEQYKDRYVYVNGPNKSQKKVLQKGDYLQLCKNVYSLERIKSQCMALDIQLIKDLIINTDGESLRRYTETDSDSAVQPGYCIRKCDGMQILNHKGKPTNQTSYSGRRGKTRETEDQIHEGRKEHPHY